MATFPSYVSTIRALEKKFNEDHVDLFEWNNVLFAMISDGQGSKSETERASVLAINEFKEIIKRSSFHDGNTLAPEIKRAFYSLNRMFKLMRGYEGEKLGQLTCGLTVACLFPDYSCLIAHTGNARCLLLRDGQLHRLTADHTEGYEKFQKNEISLTEFKSLPESRYLTRYFGQKDDDNICDFGLIQCSQNDVLLLLSDGVFFHLADEEYAMLIKESYGVLSEATDYILDLAGERQSFDDRSAGIIVCSRE